VMIIANTISSLVNSRVGGVLPEWHPGR
jgi:hypothetical protein